MALNIPNIASLRTWRAGVQYYCMQEREKESIGAKIRSFMKGIASIGGALGPKNPYEGLSPKEADTRASRSDWEAVGGDLRTAIRQFQESTIPTCPKK